MSCMRSGRWILSKAREPDVRWVGRWDRDYNVAA